MTSAQCVSCCAAGRGQIYALHLCPLPMGACHIGHHTINHMQHRDALFSWSVMLADWGSEPGAAPGSALLHATVSGKTQIILCRRDNQGPL